MQGNLLSFIREDPIRNSQRIWLDYLPNDPFCQQSIKQGRDYAISKTSRCSECHDVMPEGMSIERYNHTKLLCSFNGARIATDTITNQVITLVMLEELIPQYVRPLERVYRCSDRVTMVRSSCSTSLEGYDVIAAEIKTVCKKLQEAKVHLLDIRANTVTVPFTIEAHTSMFKLNNKYVMSPIMDEHDQHPDVFQLTHYPSKHTVHYMRLHNNNVIYDFGQAIIVDYYRLICALTMKYNAYDSKLFESLFLPSELSRVVTRIKAVKQHVEQYPDYDMIHCLHDREGFFAMRLNVLE